MVRVGMKHVDIITESHLTSLKAGWSSVGLDVFTLKTPQNNGESWNATCGCHN